MFLFLSEFIVALSSRNWTSFIRSTYSKTRMNVDHYRTHREGIARIANELHRISIWISREAKQQPHHLIINLVMNLLWDVMSDDTAQGNNFFSRNVYPPRHSPKKTTNDDAHCHCCCIRFVFRSCCVLSASSSSSLSLSIPPPLIESK